MTIYANWTYDELTLIDRIIAGGGDVRKRDLLLFPNRTEKSVVRKASIRRKALGLARAGKGDHRRDFHPQPDRALSMDAIDARHGSDRLHRATVEMCIRNRITLPGLSAAHTRAIAQNLGIVA